MTDVSEVAEVTAAIALPLNLLWRPADDLSRLAAAGVARVRTGSAPYRRALAAGLATAVAARDDSEPPVPDLARDSLLRLPRASYSTPRSSA